MISIALTGWIAEKQDIIQSSTAGTSDRDSSAIVDTQLAAQSQVISLPLSMPALCNFRSTKNSILNGV